MVQEEKDLLIKDLSARLSYGVKVKLPNDNEHYTLLSVSWNKGVAIIGMEIDGMYATSKVKIEDCKPYLRSLEDMTEEELAELNCLCYHNITVQDNSLCGYICCGEIEDVTDWLNRKNFAYRTLNGKDMFELGLAIRATNGNNPYDTQKV